MNWQSILKVDFLSVECPTCDAPKGKPCVKFPTKEQDPNGSFQGRLNYDAGRIVPMAGVHKARRVKALYWRE
tara:strand:+ start:1043 stop:1258 length:216 start_codon:yes stop_codon:yes gene_type:complete